MVNKKGWIRIVEAFLAVIILTGVIFVILANRTGNLFDNEEAIYNMQKAILNEVQANDTLRAHILASITGDENEASEDNENYIKVNEFIKSRVPKSFNFKIKICQLSYICNLDEYHENTYVNEAVISSTLQDYSPKKIRLFMWAK